MEHYNKKSVSDDLRKYDHLAKDSDFIEITEWHNGDKKQWYLDAYKKFDNVCYNLG